MPKFCLKKHENLLFEYCKNAKTHFISYLVEQSLREMLPVLNRAQQVVEIRLYLGG